MFACNLPLEMVDLGIKLKDLLIDASYESAASIDYFLCQYNYKCVNDKEELIDSMLTTFNTRKCMEMFVSDEALQGINKFRSLLEKLKSEFVEIHNIEFDRFIHKDKEYLVMRDVFNWVIMNNQIIVIMKENGDYFEDNLVALNVSGEVIWDSKNCIECPNRMGAIFVGLRLFDEETIVANAYVGINYYMDIKTGKVKDKVITK